MHKRGPVALVTIALLAGACGGTGATPTTAAITAAASRAPSVEASAGATSAAPSVDVSTAPSVEVSTAPSVAPSAEPSAEGSPTPSGGPSSEPSGAPSPSASAPVSGATCDGQQVSFLLSFIPNVQHAGFLVAANRGYYEEEGIDLDLQPGAPGTDVTQAVGDGTVDLGQIDYVDIVEARAAGVPVKAVAQIYKEPFFFWYSSKESGIDSMEDWAGRSVGAIQTGDYPERDAMLLGAGLSLDDIEVVQQDFGTESFIAGDVEIAEGVVFYHPAYLVGVDQRNWPDDFNVFSPKELGADFASQTVAANEDFLAGDPAAVSCFLRASIRGWRDALADPAGAIDDVMAFIPEGAIPRPHQEAAINDVLPIVGEAGDPDLLQLTPEKYESTVQQLISLGYLEGEVDIAATYDSSFYDAMGEIPE